MQRNSWTEIVMNTDENISVSPTYYFSLDESYITLEISNFYANDYVVEQWNRHKERYELEDVELKIKQGKDFQTDFQAMLDEYAKGAEGANNLASLVAKKDNMIVQLQEEIEYLEDNPIFKPDPIKLDDLLAGFKIDYPEYRNIVIDRGISLNKESKMDTSYSLRVWFKKDIKEPKKEELNSKLSRRVKLELWQKGKFKQDSVYVFTFD